MSAPPREAAAAISGDRGGRATQSERPVFRGFPRFGSRGPNAKALRKVKADERVRRKFRLPEDDVILGVFKGAMLKTILCQGRIYVTTSAICFYSNLFGITTKEPFWFRDIAVVKEKKKKKRSGLLVHTWTIKLVDPQKPDVVFGSTPARGKLLQLIDERMRAWHPDYKEAVESTEQAAEDVDGDASVSSMPGITHSQSESVAAQRSFGHSQSIPSTKASIINSASLPNVKYVPSDNTETTGDSDVKDADVQSADVKGADVKGRDNPVPRNDADLTVDQQQQEVAVQSSVEDNLIWRCGQDVCDRVHGKEYQNRKERARSVLDAPMKFVLNRFFLSDFMAEYHMKNGNSNVKLTEWSRSSDGTVLREVSFVRYLGYKLGPKETRVKETYRYFFKSSGGVCVEVDGHNLDVPFGSYFRVESYFEINPIPGDENKSELVASVAVSFSKSTMLSGKIEKGTLEQTKTSFSKLIELIQVYLKAERSKVCETRQKTITEANPNPIPCSGIATSKQVVESRSVHKLQRPSFPSEVGQSFSHTEAYSGTREVSIITPNFPKSKLVATCSCPTTPELREDYSAQVLRVLSIIVLALVAVFLVCAICLLYKMSRDFSSLEYRVLNQSGKLLQQDCSVGS